MGQDASDEENYLNAIPIETLGILDNSINHLHRLGMTSVGDCIDFLQRGNNATPSFHLGFWDAFSMDVVPRLREHGYWEDDEYPPLK
jgi:hypothetical protein